MGKFVIIPQHPSNKFFEQFPNCLTYDSKADFVSQLQYALINEPTILSVELLHILTWEAATERLIEASIITRREAKRRERVGQVEVDQKAADYVKSGIFETFRKYVLKIMKDAEEDGTFT
jgi:ribosomal protein L31E